MSVEMEKRIAALELRVGVEAKTSDSKPTLAAEIEDLERRMEAMPMDDAMFMDEESVDEPGMMYMDDELAEEVAVIEPPEAEEMVEMTMDDVAVDEMGCAQASDEKESSLTRPGIEDQIIQDYLDSVAELRPGAAELETAPSMLSVAPTEYTARLKKASARLDHVAAYLEKNGRIELAFRIDKISDAIEARIKGGQ